MESLLDCAQHSYEHPVGSNRWSIVIEFRHIKELINIPDIQRELDDDWITQLATSIERDPWVDVGRLDVVCLNDALNLVNGQHRYAYLSRGDNDTKMIELRICRVSTRDEMDEIFQNVNQSRPASIAGSPLKTRVINKIGKHMTNNYNPYLSKANRPRGGNLNLEHMKKAILERWTFPGHTDDDAIVNEFISYMTRVNIDNIRRFGLHSDVGHKIRECQSKQLDKPLMLGLFHDFEWMSNPRADFIYKRPKITPSKQREVWRKDHGVLWTSTCPICREQLEQKDFHCGHIISHYNGGPTTIGNLRAICKRCNLAMGTMNMDEYMNLATE